MVKSTAVSHLVPYLSCGDNQGIVRGGNTGVLGLLQPVHYVVTSTASCLPLRKGLVFSNGWNLSNPNRTLHYKMLLHLLFPVTVSFDTVQPPYLPVNLRQGTELSTFSYATV